MQGFFGKISEKKCPNRRKKPDNKKEKIYVKIRNKGLKTAICGHNRTKNKYISKKCPKRY